MMLAGWDQRFSEPGYAYGTDANDFLISVVGRIPGGKVLSLGEGEGRNAVFLAANHLEVTALDSSAVGLEKTRALAAERGVSVSTVQADLHQYTFTRNAWQGIVSIFCHLPKPTRQRVHRQCVDALTPGGVLIIEGFSTRQLAFSSGGPRDPDLLYDFDEIRNELEGLELLIAHELERPVVEGRYHTGRAAVVQILGRRVVR